MNLISYNELELMFSFKYSGRHIVSNKNIKQNEVLLYEEAYAAVITPSFKLTNCNYCFKVCLLFLEIIVYSFIWNLEN